MASRLIIGLMSGTSVDGIDAALVRITAPSPGHYTLKVLHHLEHAWPSALRKRLLAVMAPASTSTQELCELNALVAHEFANAVARILEKSRTPREKIAALGSHGQTICHLPPAKSKIKTRKSNIASTLQIGDPSILATLTRITTVGNFRPADMTLGGQGAPLVPWADAAFLTHPTKVRCVQNIGGIANVTYLPPKRGRILAFDTGPGNMLIDALLSLATDGKQRFDRNGKIAANGILEPNLFRTLQAHPYFGLRPPKSTGRELFGQQLAQILFDNQRTRHGKFENLIHTVTRLTAWSIADAYERFLPELPDELILCGGGADNPTLVKLLREEFTSRAKLPKISRMDDHGIPNKAKEAASFALLAAATLDGVPANLSSVTGAARPTILGVIAPQP